MPRELGGNSSLGQSINKINSVGDSVFVRQTPQPKVGIIKDIFSSNGSDQYTVIVTFINPKTGQLHNSPPIPLVDHPASIAQNFGSPQDLKGKYFCKVTYNGTSMNRGTAQIIRSTRPDSEEATKWNELPVQGTSFATPGSGM